MGILATFVLSAITSAGTTAITASATAIFAAKVITGLITTLIGGLISSAFAPSAADVRQEAKRVTSQPSKRTAYGHYRVPGLRAPGDFVKGEIQYGFYLLQTRPSAGTNLKIYVDNREYRWTGDIFDFTGPGASLDPAALNDPYDWGFVNFWLGLGDQTAPPDQLMTEFGDATATDPQKFWPSDAGRGWTILWFRYVRGSQKKIPAKWPSYPEIEVDVEMDWSLVWDPLDPTQDPDDRSTWTFSENHGRCALDAVRTNPIAPYDLSRVILQDFTEAQDVADEDRERADGSFEKAFRVGGLIVWSKQELMDQLQPLAQAGAGQYRRVGGKIGYAAGKYYAPSMTLTEAMRGTPITVTPKQPSRDIPKALRPIYPDPSQNYEDGDLPVVPIAGRGWTPGQDEADPLNVSMVPYWPQVQRIALIEARRLAAQMTLDASFPPSTIDLIPGATVAVDFPGSGARNREYRVESMRPANFLEDPLGRLAFENPMTLRETSAAIFAHDPADEQEPEREGAASENVPTLDPPINIVASASAVSFGDSGASQITFTFDEPAEGGAEAYRWSYQASGGVWIAGGEIEAEDGLAGVVNNVTPNVDYQIRIKSLGLTESKYALSNTVAAIAPQSFRLVFEQSVDSDEWVITHNFGRIATVASVLDDTGAPLSPTQAHTTSTTTLTFASPVSGTATLL